MCVHKVDVGRDLLVKPYARLDGSSVLQINKRAAVHSMPGGRKEAGVFLLCICRMNGR
jgi:hypothetical protein